MGRRALEVLKQKYRKELNATKNTNQGMTVKREQFTRFIEVIDAILEVD
jgi:GTP1/Obg family GTP-binding protein